MSLISADGQRTTFYFYEKRMRERSTKEKGERRRGFWTSAWAGGCAPPLRPGDSSGGCYVERDTWFAIAAHLFLASSPPQCSSTLRPCLGSLGSSRE